MSVKKILTKSLNILFPVKCVCCGKLSENLDGNDVLCLNCREILREEAAFDCNICGKPPYLCVCKKIEHIDSLVFPYYYKGDIIRRVIYKIKKANLYYINEFFAKDMYNSLKLCGKIKTEDIDFITNTPRMKSSVILYGYNQTQSLAKFIAEYSGITYLPVLEARKSYDREQKSLDKTERALNVRNKFAPVKKIENNKNILKDKNMLIIDDVVTTGSTLSECARIMKNMGAKNIYALCAASVSS